jgi:tetratricopeptide (TPR) repeat protein
MKTTVKLIIVAVALLVLVASANAQSPREELQQMIEQLQKTPTDHALREKIIQLAPTLNPSPALPDAAIAFEGRGQFAFRSATSEGDFLAAAQEYEKAVAVAPWVPGYYADLCTIYEKAGKFEDAKRHCGFYLVGLTDPAQVTDVKRRIAGLEYGIEKANSPEEKWKKALAQLGQAQQKYAGLIQKIHGSVFFAVYRNEKVVQHYEMRFQKSGVENGYLEECVKRIKTIQSSDPNYPVMTQWKEQEARIVWPKNEYEFTNCNIMVTNRLSADSQLITGDDFSEVIYRRQ